MSASPIIAALLGGVHQGHKFRARARGRPPKAAVLLIASEAVADAVDARFIADASMQLANSSLALVGRRKGEEGPQTPSTAMKVSPRIPAIMSWSVRPGVRVGADAQAVKVAHGGDSGRVESSP